ncbi:subtilisin-like protein [Lepidopterella palustris CBS 459.81]|uniref:Subtilisin-like protein n=1 Tax=Lepidopterella palustris CBS 459.81 TaxID=1314670 RepID=A0A8E2JA98_9PEZI|nr:subtilisin-like protein [Lepidopterella palustris CBS 459.81]
MAPISYTPMALLLETARIIREIAKLLKNDDKDRELKHFYSRLMAHCLMVRDHANRIKAAIALDNELILRILALFESIVTTHVLRELSAFPVSSYFRLRALCQHWDKMRDQNDSIKLEFVKQCLNFGLASEQRDEFLESLENWEDDLTTQYPEDPSQWSKDDFGPQRKSRSEPSYAVWNAAQSLFKALMASKNCTCQPTHEFGARLCLGTYRKPDLDEDIDQDFDFDMYLSTQQDWQEVHVHTVKEAVVQFAVNDEELRPQKKKLGYKLMEVKKLCEPIEKIRKMASHRLDRLEFKVERGRLWKLRSERSSFPIDRTKAPVSLEQFIKEGSRSLTEKTKRILAVLLSYAVLHLHGTPWLQPTWGSSSIIFFQTASSTIPLRPFIQTQLVQEGTGDVAPELDRVLKHEEEDCDPDDCDPDEIDPDDVDPDDLVLHHCPPVVALAVMLMELYLATPFEMLAKKYGVDLPDGIQNRTLSIDADLVFQGCKSEIPENSQFRYAVEKCLDPKTWQDENGMKLDNQMLRTTIYQEVVWPLEDELSQAFSYISIDELDKIAQTLDFGSWGQSIQSQQAAACSPPNEFASPHDPQYFVGLQGYIQQTEAHAWGRLVADVPYIAQRPEQKMARKVDYKESKFFDDETLSEDHSPEDDFQKVYEEFVQKHLQNRLQSPVKIAILDTGVDLNHPDMDARDNQIKGKYNWFNERFKKMVPDHVGHGTHTAGLLLDYAPDAELYIAKIAEDKPSDPRMIAKAIDFAVKSWQVDIISMSFGFPTCDVDGYDELERAIENAHSKHVLMFAAASNSGANLNRAYPARDQHVICIHSTDANGNRSSFSPTAITDDTNIATVGQAVESAWPVHLCDEKTNPTFVKYKSGTSYATPIAAGIAAFLLQYAKLHLREDQLEKLKRQSGMKAVLRKIAQKSQESKLRDDYYYVALSLYSDNLFGKTEGFIKETIIDILKNS